MLKNYKNVKLTAGMVLAGLAGTASVSATHSAVAHASTVVASDQSKTNNTQAGEQKDSQKTLTFTTANAENSSKIKNGGTEGSLNHTAPDNTVPLSNKDVENQNANLNESNEKRSFDQAVSDANEQSITITYVDDDGKGQTVGSPVTITGKTGQTVATNITAPENYYLSPLQNPLPKQITFTDKAIDPIIVHLKHQTEYRDVTQYFDQRTSFSLSGPYGAVLTTPSDDDAIDQTISIKGTRKYDLVTRNFIGETTWDQDHRHIYQGVDAVNSLGDLDKTYVSEDDIYGPELELSQNKDLEKLFDGAQVRNGSISTQTWLKDELHADGYYLSEKTSLVFDGKSWLNLKEYQEKVDPNFTWTTTNDSVVMQGDHAVDHINPEKITPDLLTKLPMADDDSRFIYLNYVPYTYKHHSAKRTINIHLPNGEVKTITQNADAKQPVFTVYTYSDARNDKSASQETGNWTSGEWAEYDAPVVAGYTASQPTVSAKTVTGDTQNETIDITYVATPDKPANADKTDNDRDKSGTATNTGTNTDKGQQANDPSKDGSKTATDGKTTTDQGKTDMTKTDNQDQTGNVTAGDNTTTGDNNQQADSGKVTVSGGDTTVNVSDGKQSSATDQSKTNDGTTNTADKGQQSRDASHTGNITNASDNKQTVTTDPSANAGNTDAKIATDTKKDSTASNSSAKSNSTVSSATDKAKSNVSVANGQSNADKAKTAETANRAVIDKTAKTASTAKTAPKADTANVASESGKATVAKTNKQVATGNTKKSANKSTSSSQKAGNTTSANAGNDSNSKATLPQTGNSSSTAGILAGSAIIATMASLGIAYNKKKRNA